MTARDLQKVGFYLSIVSVDISVLSERVAVEDDDWVKNVFARQLIVLIHEIIDDVPDLFGNQLRGICTQLPDSAAHLDDLSLIGKDMRYIRKNHKKTYYDIRNIVGAHRDLDGEKQYDILETIDTVEVLAISSEVDMFLGRYMNLLTNIITDYSVSHLAINEIVEKIQRVAASDH